jgi:hypothetical protein
LADVLLPGGTNVNHELVKEDSGSGMTIDLLGPGSSNPYGAGSPFKPDGINNPFSPAEPFGMEDQSAVYRFGVFPVSMDLCKMPPLWGQAQLLNMWSQFTRSWNYLVAA